MTEAKGEPRRLVVLRHGQTVSNLKGIWQGHLDHELTDLGREQAAAAARAIASLRPTRIVSSDLSRAHDTALAVAAASGDLDVAVDERWREIHAGAWQGLTAAEVGEQYPLDAERLVSGEDFKRGGHGESLAELAQRVRPAIDELVDGRAHPLGELGERLAVATPLEVLAAHEPLGVERVLLAHLRGRQPLPGAGMDLAPALVDGHVEVTARGGDGQCRVVGPGEVGGDDPRRAKGGDGPGRSRGLLTAEVGQLVVEVPLPDALEVGDRLAVAQHDEATGLPLRLGHRSSDCCEPTTPRSRCGQSRQRRSRS